MFGEIGTLSASLAPDVAVLSLCLPVVDLLLGKTLGLDAVHHPHVSLRLDAVLLSGRARHHTCHPAAAVSSEIQGQSDRGLDKLLLEAVAYKTRALKLQRRQHHVSGYRRPCA